jgi:4-hydroxybenzoate polyprenyltransferase
MTALQASIGALNDVVDARTDAVSKPAKPIPSGEVSLGQGRAVAVLAAIGGVVLAGPSGLAATALAVAVLGVGYAYDLRAKGTAWSWLPFAAGIPLLPLFAWFGTRDDWLAPLTILIPAAATAGGGLAIANARADLERDARAGVNSIAVALGLDRSWLIHAVLQGAVLAVALFTVAGKAASIDLAFAGVASAIVAIGVGLGWRGSARRRERAWEVQAVGIAVLAAAWLRVWGAST